MMMKWIVSVFLVFGLQTALAQLSNEVTGLKKPHFIGEAQVTDGNNEAATLHVTSRITRADLLRLHIALENPNADLDLKTADSVDLVLTQPHPINPEPCENIISILANDVSDLPKLNVSYAGNVQAIVGRVGELEIPTASDPACQIELSDLLDAWCSDVGTLEVEVSMFGTPTTVIPTRTLAGDKACQRFD